MVPAIGNKLVETYQIPVGFIPAAKGGVSLMAEYNGWLKRNEGNPADRSNLYGNSLYRARAAGGIEFIIMEKMMCPEAHRKRFTVRAWRH